MNEYVKQYIDIRNSLIEQLHPMMDVYTTGMWDPLMKHIIIKELKQLIIKELSREFPDFPIQYLPHIKIKADDGEPFIEAETQAYLNQTNGLTFLGNTDHGGVIYDLYCRESWDPNFSHVFYARHGHESSSYEKGSKTAAAEYMIGMQTPLSIAYGLAIDEGYIV